MHKPYDRWSYGRNFHVLPSMNGYVVAIIILIAIILALLVVIYRLWKQTQRSALGLDELAEDILKALYRLLRTKPDVRSNYLVCAAGLQPDRTFAILLELTRRSWAKLDGETIQILPAGK